MVSIRNLLIATDFSPHSDRAVREGFVLAERFGAHVHLMHVVQDPLDEVWAGYVPASDFVDVLNAHKAAALKQLRVLARRCGGRQYSATLVTPYGPAVDEILQYAAANDIDFIVCGTHGRRGLEHLIMGSVAEQLVQRARCPVLTVSAARGAFAAA